MVSCRDQVEIAVYGYVVEQLHDSSVAQWYRHVFASTGIEVIVGWLDHEICVTLYGLPEFNDELSRAD